MNEDELLNNLYTIHTYMQSLLDDIDLSADMNQPPLYSFVNTIDRATLSNIELIMDTISNQDNTDTVNEYLSTEEFWDNVNIIHTDDKEEEECVICMDLIKSGSICIQTKCGHIFHELCIKRWLTTKQNTCPTCRCSVKKCEE